MDFKEKITKLENEELEDVFLYKVGNIPVLLSAPHTMIQQKEDSFKLNEPFTKAIARYISKELDCSCLVKIKDTMIDANGDEMDEYKKILTKIIEENNIELVIDIHGASKDKPFDVELGTLNNLSADYSTINELKEAFIENGINNIALNDPFKGGGITRYIYGTTDIDVVQIEINRNYRDIEQVENIEKVCNSLIKFIKQYIK